MKRNFTLALLSALFVFSSVNVRAQIVWDFTTATPTSNSYANINVSAVTQGNNNGTTTLLTTTSPSSGYSGASGGNNAGLAARAIGYDPSQTAYFEFTLTPTGANSVVLTGISMGSRSTATGPQAISVRSSVDNYATDQLNMLTAANSTWAFYTGMLNVTGIAGTPVTVRIYGYNGTGSPGLGTANWRIDDLIINPAPLPLNLLSFKASFNGKAAMLNWNTANELNVDGFSVEKSVNGIAFNEITFVRANNSQLQSTYTAQDLNVQDGANYYRLKMIDRDGSAKYSTIVVVNSRKGLAAHIYPNPTQGNIAVTHPKASAKSLIRIVNIEGKQVRVYPVEAGALQTSLTVGELAKGNYVLVFEDSGVRSTTSFVKQ